MRPAGPNPEWQAPAITAGAAAGGYVVGDTLSTTNGSWSNSPTGYTYQWQRVSGGVTTNIQGATSQTYQLQPADAGDMIQVLVTAANRYGSSAPALSATIGPIASGGLYTLPADRTTVWNPGLNSAGGIPSANWAVHQTLSPSGGDDTAAINTALSNAAAVATAASPQVVKLTAGVFKISGGGVQIGSSHVVLRGVGPGPGTWAAGVAATGTGGTYLVKATGSGTPVVTIGNWDSAPTVIALTSDAMRGTNSCAVASASGLSTGQLVIVSHAIGDTTVTTAVPHLNAFAGTGVLSVASTADFPSQGTLNVVTASGNAVVTYTGISGSAFTGCTFVYGATPNNVQFSDDSVASGAIVLDSTLAHWNTTSPENNPNNAYSGWFEFADRPMGQVLEIASISGSTLTFTTDFHVTHSVAQTAQLSPLSTVTYSGIEDLYLYGGEGGDGGGGMHLNQAGYCWVKHIEDTWCSGAAIHLNRCFRCEIRDSYWHDSQQGPVQGGGSYGIGFNWYTADCLMENCISVWWDKCMVMRSSGGGNVVAYNYLDYGLNLAGGPWLEESLNSSHMTCPHYELFEGNRGANFGQDDRWGNSLYITLFRNHLYGKLSAPASWDTGRTDYSSINIQCAGKMTMWHSWQSFVGNVLGFSGQTWATGYEVIGGEFAGYSWMLGYHESGNETLQDKTLAYPTGQTMATLLRDGNYDYFTGQVHWHGVGGTGQNNGLTPPPSATLPQSLYLSAKPAFFASNVWPWVDGSNAVDPLPGTLPAVVRYDAGTPNA